MIALWDNTGKRGNIFACNLKQYEALTMAAGGPDILYSISSKTL